MKKAAFAAILALSVSAPALAHSDPLPVGACINMGNSLEPMQEGGWGGQDIVPADFQRIKAAGFETVRIPVRWSNKSADEAPYTIDPKFMARVTEVVDAALAADLKVMLNSHHFDEIHKDPLGNADKLAGMWTQIAAQFADRPEDQLWFEIENEPHENFNNSNLVATITPALAAIRASNPTRAVIMGGEFWSGIDSLATLDLPDDPNIHPTFHYYEPFDFTHQGASWVGDKPPPVGRLYGTQADAERLEADVAKLQAYMTRTGMTPIMGETGAYDKAPLEQRVAYHTAVTEAFAPSGVGMCAWAYANTFPFWDHSKGEWLPGLRAAFGLPEDD
ncbi:glycoside hydrolase family 5 protein [Altererythrobacter sp. ZODW24]|uniref:glycoside hydrolase family 5 protein n=1 Tax=Altererythrobacter sp. ZODW24 TaxID=2185142 RepID=UPI0013B45E4B|nr:glycoside hydrolase family 5 protein [Altererythrobacter sp. ZODW24]